MTIQLGTVACEPGTLAGEIFDALFAAYDPPGDPANIPLFKAVAFAFATGQYEGLRSQIADGEAIVRDGLTLSGGAGGGGGTITGASNVGGGEEVYKDTLANVIRLRTLTGSGSVSVTQGADTIDIAGGGEANTASNLGAGAQVFASKVGIDLQHRSLVSTDGSVTIAQGATELDIEVDPSVVDHGGLAGLGDDDHTQYLLADGTRPLTGAWNAGAFQITSGSLIPAASATYDIGATASRWRNAFVGALLLAGAVAADATAAADDLVIGAGSAAHGATIYTGVASSGSLYFADSAGGTQGGLVYSHSTNTLTLRANSTNVAVVSSSVLYPGSDASYDIGILATNRWANGYFSGNLVSSRVFTGGATSTTGANVGGDDLIIGTTATSFPGMSILSTNTGVARVLFGDSDDADVGSLIYDHTNNVLAYTIGGGTRFNMSAAALYPQTTNTYDLGLTGTRWRNGYFSGDVEVTGNVVAVGNGTFARVFAGGATSTTGTSTSADDIVIGTTALGSVGLTILTTNTGTARINFGDSDDDDVGNIAYTHTDNVMTLRMAGISAYNFSSGEVYPASDNAKDLGIASTNRWRDAHFSRRVYVAGGVSGHDANADDLVVGNLTAAVFGITLAGTTGGAVNFADTLGGSQGRIVYLHSTDTMTFGAASADQYTMSATAFYPNTDNARNLGISGTNRWQHGYFSGDLTADQAFLAGATTAGSVDAAADDVVIGTTASTAPGLSLVGTNTSTHSIYFADSGATNPGGITYGHTSDVMTFRAGATNIVQISSAALAPVTDGTGTLGTSSLGWDQLWFSERAGAPTSAASRGALYVDDRAPNALWFLDDTGVERNISRMPSITLGAERSEGVPAITLSINSYLYWRALPATGTTYLVWMIQVPYTYDGQPLTLRVAWAPGSTAAGNVYFRYHIRRYVAGESQIVSNATTTDIAVASGGTQNVQQINTLTTSLTLDSAVAGDTVTIALIRLGDDINDTLTGSTANVHAVMISETVT
jgi:hypothetical protein